MDQSGVVEFLLIVAVEGAAESVLKVVVSMWQMDGVKCDVMLESPVPWVQRVGDGAPLCLFI